MRETPPSMLFLGGGTPPSVPDAGGGVSGIPPCRTVGFSPICGIFRSGGSRGVLTINRFRAGGGGWIAHVLGEVPHHPNPGVGGYLVYPPFP